MLLATFYEAGSSNFEKKRRLKASSYSAAPRLLELRINELND